MSDRVLLERVTCCKICSDRRKQLRRFPPFRAEQRLMTASQLALSFPFPTPTMTRYYCHECSHEGSDFATSPDGFTCPRCGGAFVEEVRLPVPPWRAPPYRCQTCADPRAYQIPDNDGMADDPREFDPVDEDDEEHHPFGFFRSASGAADNHQAPNRAGNGRFFHYESPGGGFVFTGGFGGAGGAAPPQHPGASNPLAYSLMQAFGLAPQAQGPQAAAAANAHGNGRAATGEGRPQARRWQSAGANEPANRQQQQQHGQDQVPIQNLAASVHSNPYLSKLLYTLTAEHSPPEQFPQ